MPTDKPKVVIEVHRQFGDRASDGLYWTWRIQLMGKWFASNDRCDLDKAVRRTAHKFAKLADSQGFDVEVKGG